jgi:hypothetical protein
MKKKSTYREALQGSTEIQRGSQCLSERRTRGSMTIIEDPVTIVEDPVTIVEDRRVSVKKDGDHHRGSEIGRKDKMGYK